MKTFHFSLADYFEFEAKMPEELLAKAMSSSRPIFLTDQFMAKVAATKPDELIRELVSDLHRETAADETVEFLRWMYLFMDFEQDLPRLMLMSDAEIKDTPTRKRRDG